MIKQNKFQILTDEAESQYKFGFCNLCEFYECELVREYMQFKENGLSTLIWTTFIRSIVEIQLALNN